MVKKMTRRIFLQTTAAAVGGLALRSGLPTPNLIFRKNSAAAVKLTQITSSDQVPYWEYVNEQFKKSHPDVEFDLINTGYDQMRTKTISALSAGAPMDVFTLDIIWVGEFAKEGFCLPLDDEMSKEEKAAFLPGSLEGLQAGGKQVAMPAAAWFKNLFYNKDIVGKIGLDAPPPTYEQLVKTGAKAKADAAVKYIMGWGWNQSEGMICDWTVLLHAFGGTWFDKSGKWVINNDNGMAALTYMVDNLKSRVFDPASITFDDRAVMNPFLVGDYMAMCSWGLWGWNMSNDTKESKIIGKADVGLLYGSEAAKTQSATCSGISGISVNANSPNKDLAVAWAREFAGIGKLENTKAAMKLSGMPPVQAAAWEDATLVKENPALPKLANQAKYMYARPSAHVANYTEWSTMAQAELSKALAGQQAPKQALDTIVENSNRDFPGINF